MDGIAIRHEAFDEGRRTFRIQATQAAGDAPLTLASPDDCIEIMTGAAMPDGADTVIRYEDVDMRDGAAAVRDDARVDARQNIHFRGSDRVGGKVVVPRGTRLYATHIAALASVGAARVAVAAQPRVVVISTGNELVGVDADVLPHQIRQSNAPAVRAALTARGIGDVRMIHERDEETVLRVRIDDALASADVVLLSGGVSAGKFDLVPRLLVEAGVERVFHKIRQKPGKPLWFGMKGNTAVFGLPGNPVSSLVCLARYVLPFIDACSGQMPMARPSFLLTDLPKPRPGFTQFVPVRVQGDRVLPVPSNGSGDFLSLVPSNGFVETGPEIQHPTPVPFFPWP